MMGDMAEVFKDLRLDSQERSASNRINSTKILMGKKVRFEIFNNGYHLRVDGDVDFWPSTGLWKLKNGKQGRGVFPLLKMLKERKRNADSAQTVG